MMTITCWILCMPCSAGAAAVTPCDLAGGWATLNAAMAHRARTGYSTKRRRCRTCLPFTLSGAGIPPSLPIAGRIRVLPFMSGRPAGETGRARAVDTGQRAALRSDGLMRWNAAFYPALERGEWGGGSVGSKAWRDQDAVGGGR